MHKRRPFPLALTFLTVAGGFGGLAQAETRVPGTKVFYSYQKDPMNDANLSFVFLDEQNDTGSNTYLTMRCSSGQGVYFGIVTKHLLLQPGLTEEELDELADDHYTVSYRVGTAPASTVTDVDSAWLSSKLRPDSLLFSDAKANTALAQGLIDGQKVAIRIAPLSRSAAITRQLDYTFMPQGFAQAFAAVKSCK